MDHNPIAPPPLQFDTATPVATATVPAGGQSVTCASCGGAVVDEYFDVNGQSVCRACRDVIARHGETPRGLAVLAKALGLGVAAAIVGAVVYYAVIAITDFEIGIVAVATGYIVGFAVRHGAGGRGGRRFQVMAVALTYWSVGLAYVPLVIQAGTRSQEEQLGQAQTQPAATPESAPVNTAENNPPASFGLALVLAMAFSLILPVLTVVSDFPGGLLSVIIIGVGLHQAWRMTGAADVLIQGPYRVGPDVVST